MEEYDNTRLGIIVAPTVQDASSEQSECCDDDCSDDCEGTDCIGCVG